MLKPNALGLGLSAALAIGICPAVRAENLTVNLDPAKTKISFVVSDVLHTVRGDFHLKEGHLVFDPVLGTVSGSVIVDAASGNSGSRPRDERMTRNVLEARSYPEIRFTPSKITGAISGSGLSNVEVSGAFLIHGQAHQITIPMQVQMSQGEVTATGKFIVPYVQWGMKSPSTFLLKVNDNVEIDLTAIGNYEEHRTK